MQSRMKKRIKKRIMTLGYITVLTCLQLFGFAQQPANTINIITEGGAAGDGETDDAGIINSVIYQAFSQGKNVYFPPGIYLVKSNIQAKDSVSLYGDKDGLSVLKAGSGALYIGDTGTGADMDNINIEDLHFNNITLKFKGSQYKSGHTVRRCIFMANSQFFKTEAQLNWIYVREGTVEHCLFLRQSVCQEGPGISNFKTNNCLIKGNIWGLDLNQLEWLSTEWKGYESWNNLIQKLQSLQTTFNLDWDQGRFKAAYYPNRVVDEKIYDNIFNGSPFYGDGRDHVIYTKDYTNLEIVGNWMRGWPVDPHGGLKMRNAYGPAIVAANHFVNTPILQYTYEATAVPEVYQNVLIYRNWFDISEGLDFKRLGISYWENKGIGEDINIEYDKNTYNCAPGIGNIYLGGGSNLAEHHVYATNYYAGTNTLIPIHPAGTAYASGEPDSKRTEPFEAYTIPFYDIPNYGGMPTSVPMSPIPTTSSKGLDIYPNPIKDGIFTIKPPEDDRCGTIHIINFQGQLIYQDKIDGITKWHASTIFKSKGSFLVKYIGADTILVKKVIVH